MKKSTFDDATIGWPLLDDETFVIGDTVEDSIDRPGEKGIVEEVIGDFHYKIRWPGNDIQEYDNLESVFLKKVKQNVQSGT